MPRSQKVPSYRRHKQSGQAIVTLVGPTGQRKDRTLGTYGSPESRAEYARVIAEWEASARSLATSQEARCDLSVGEVMLRFWLHVEQHYRNADGEPTSEVENFRYSLKPLRALYGHTPVSSFGPLSLKAVREHLVGARLARKVINQRIGRIKGMFKWAVGEELVPPAVFQGLQAVAGLQKDRCRAKEPTPIAPVDDAHVDAVLPFLSRHVRALVKVQRMTGMRPSEACRLRRCDLDMAGDVWKYRPVQHKSVWRGKPRVVPLGPNAQAVLREFFTEETADYLFSPRRSMAEFRAGQRANRRTPVPPTQVARAARKPKKRLGERYTHRSYDYAVRKACVKAKVPHWHPNQLRHTYGTEVRKRYGLEGAQVSLGHARADVTQVYAERDSAFAGRIASEIG